MSANQESEVVGEIASYHKGHPSYAPWWFRVLAAADFDPLRAQEITERLSARWWYYHELAEKGKARAARQMAKKAK